MYEFMDGYNNLNNPWSQNEPFKMAPIQIPSNAPNNSASQQPAINSQMGLPTTLAGGVQLGVGSIQTLGNLWNSYQQQQMAQKALKFQMKAYKTNLANQTKSYNTALEDRIRARYATEGRSGEADDYINKNKL